MNELSKLKNWPNGLTNNYLLALLKVLIMRRNKINIKNFTFVLIQQADSYGRLTNWYVKIFFRGQRIQLLHRKIRNLKLHLARLLFKQFFIK